MDLRIALLVGSAASEPKAVLAEVAAMTPILAAAASYPEVHGSGEELQKGTAVLLQVLHGVPSSLVEAGTAHHAMGTAPPDRGPPEHSPQEDPLDFVAGIGGLHFQRDGALLLDCFT